jgi:hypothetical protein
MPISKPRDQTRRLVLARSGNQCAYPACTKPLYSDTELLGQLAHIKGNKPGSPRHDPNQDPEQRQGSANLIAVCNEHGMLIDDPSNVDRYTVAYLAHLKNEHETRIEDAADRSWVQPPSSVVGGQFGDTPIYFWKDREGRLRVYTDDQRAMLGELMGLNLDISALGTTLQALRSLKTKESESLLEQSYAEIAREEELYERIAQRMSIAPDITFGEFLRFVVQGGDATPLINLGAQLRLDIIEGRRRTFYFFAKPDEDKGGSEGGVT